MLLLTLVTDGKQISTEYTPLILWGHDYHISDTWIVLLNMLELVLPYKKCSIS